MTRVLAGDFSAGQRAARDALISWYRNGSREFRLHGFAGTGKTSIVRSVIDELGVPVVFAAPTNRAARVLRDAGCKPAQTIHKLIYEPPRETIDELGNTRPLWRLASGIPTAPVIVVDEASMVGGQVYRDLLRAAPWRVIAMGDPMQLPPYGESASPFMDRADALLTEVHRQAPDSPILSAAACLRDARIPLDQIVTWMRQVFVPAATLPDQSIVWRNKARWGLIANRRAWAGKPVGEPVPGDRVVVLANDHTRGLLNGDQGIVVWVEREDAAWSLQVVMPDTDETITVLTPDVAFLNEDGEKAALGLIRSEARQREHPHTAVTFADAVTCQRAQGGQWAHVEIAELNRIPNELDRRKWLYTAVTRAQQTLSLGSAA